MRIKRLTSVDIGKLRSTLVAMPIKRYIFDTCGENIRRRRHSTVHTIPLSSTSTQSVPTAIIYDLPSILPLVETDTMASVKTDTLSSVKTDTMASVKTDTMASVKTDTLSSVKTDTMASVKTDTMASVKKDSI